MIVKSKIRNPLPSSLLKMYQTVSFKHLYRDIYRKDSISTAAPAQASKMIPNRQIISNTIGKRIMVICEVPIIPDKQAANTNPHTINTKYLKAFTINLNKGLNLLVVMVKALRILSMLLSKIFSCGIVLIKKPGGALNTSPARKLLAYRKPYFILDFRF